MMKTSTRLLPLILLTCGLGHAQENKPLAEPCTIVCPAHAPTLNHTVIVN
jgi:hypothetical protein